MISLATKSWTKELLAGVLKRFGGGTPTGTLISFMGKTAPTGYLACDGTEYNIADYKNLADFIKEQFGTVNNFGGDGETTFAVPDLRGEFIRGTGTNGHENQGSGADVGVHQDATEVTHVLPWQTGLYYYAGEHDNKTYGIYSFKNNDGVPKQRKISKRGVVHSTSTDNYSMDAAYYTRPTNTSILYCIKF